MNWSSVGANLIENFEMSRIRCVLSFCFSVNCAVGYYGVANGTCLPCPSGFYQPNVGRTECIKCPFRRSRTESGAFAQSQCIDICES